MSFNLATILQASAAAYPERTAIKLGEVLDHGSHLSESLPW